MKNIVQLIGIFIFVCLFSAAAYAVSIWGATDRAPAVGTMRFPVDTNSGSGPGYLEVQDVVDLTLLGNATTATALAANGANCSAGSAPLGVNASGAVESCTDYEEDLSNSTGLAAALSDESGTGVVAFTTSPVFTTPNIGSATGSISGNAGTATALAANGSNCPAGQYARGVDASGNAENCTVDSGSGGAVDSVNGATGVVVLDQDDIADGSNYVQFSSAQESKLNAISGTNTGDQTSVSGNAGTATLAATSTIVDGTDATSFPLIVDSATGSLALKTDGGLLYDASNGTLSSTVFNTPTLTLTGTGTLNGLDAIDGTTETTLEAAIDIAGDVSGTGLGSVVIGADKVLESMLKAVDAASDEECLTYETTTGDFEWQSCGSGGSLSDGDKGDIVVSGSGSVWSIDTGVIVNADVNASAAIDATKIHDGTISNTEYGYLNGLTGNIQTQIDGITADGFAAYSSGGTYSFAVDANFTSTIDPDSDTSFAVGINNALGAARGHDWITAIGSDITADGNAVVVIGRLGVVDCVNGVSIGDGNTLNCNGGVTEKSAIFGNDNNYSGIMDHFYGIGSNNTSTTGCRQCGIFGEGITNNKNGSFGIGNPSLAGGSVTVGTTNTIWFADELYVKMGGDTETDVTALTCDSTSRGLVQYNQSEAALNVCNGSAWQSIPMVPTAGANNVAISQYSMTFLDETSEANVKAALNAEAGVDFQAYDADLTSLAAGGAAFTALAGNATKPDLYADLGAGYEKLCFPGSDFNSTALTAITGVVDETPPLHATFTVTGVYAYVRTAPTGTLTIDINEGAGAGTSILSTKLTIDSGEYNGGSSGYQGTAATAAVISDTSIASFAHITADVDSTTGGKGLMVCLVGHY